METLGKYCPQTPWPRQQTFLEAFLSLSVKEVLYGGAAGPGKSSALLMAALMYVDVPGYAALILRKDSQRLRLSGGLIPRSHEWLSGKGVDWNGNDKRWTFPSGASIQFGYLDNSTDKYRYGSSEYQFIGFDELTEFAEEDYLFLFSRLRMTRAIESQGVPYRIAGATNPGGIGHLWCKERFITREAEDDLRQNELKPIYTKTTKTGLAAFVPGKIRDNPAVNPETYIENLMHLSPVVRERLMNGDWTIMPTGLIKPEWLRYYTMRGRIIQLNESKLDTEGNIIHTSDIIKEFDERECRRFVTIDTAGGQKNITKESKGKPASHFVAQVWDHKRYGDTQCLLLRHMKRGREGFVTVANWLRELHREYQPSSMYVENMTMGPDLVDLLSKEMPIQCIGTEGKDKVTRASPVLNMMAKGQVYLPRYNNDWRTVVEAEWLGWQGLDEETNDICDATAYAGICVGGFGEGVMRLDHDPRDTSSFDVRNSSIRTPEKKFWM